MSADRLRRTRPKRERTVLAALIATMIVNQTGVVIISPLVVDIGATFGVSIALAGQLRTVSALVSALVAPSVGVLSDRIGRKPLLLFGLTVIGLAGLGSALAPSFAILMIVQAAGGFGIAALLSMGYAAVGDYFEPRRRPWAMGMVNIGQPLAWVVGLPLIGFLADVYGWRWSFIGVPLAFSVVGALFALRLPPAPYVSSPSRSPESGNAIKSIAADRSAVCWIIAELAAYVGWAGTLTFLGAFYITQYGLGAGIASPLLALTALGFVCGSLTAHRLVLRQRQQVVILASAAASGVLLSTVLTVEPALPLAVGLLFVFGVSQGVRGATSSALGLQQAPAYRGTMMALRASVVQFGYVFGGLIAGALLEPGGYPAVGLVCSALIVFGGLLTLWLVSAPVVEGSEFLSVRNPRSG